MNTSTQVSSQASNFPRSMSDRQGGSGGLSRLVWPILALWFGAALTMSLAGVFDTTGTMPIALGLGVVLPVLVFLISWSAIPAFRAFVLGLNTRALIWIHAVRIVGVVFVILYYRGVLPGSFANPAGWGDIAAAVTAPLIAMNLSRLSKRFVVGWNLYGMLDLVTAVTLGVLNSTSPIGVLTHDVTTRPMGQFPLSLVPTFGVPLLFICHLAVLFQLREDARATTMLHGRALR